MKQIIKPRTNTTPPITPPMIISTCPLEFDLPSSLCTCGSVSEEEGGGVTRRESRVKFLPDDVFAFMTTTFILCRSVADRLDT